MQCKQKKAVFFDRDGVLNHVVMKDGRPRSPRTLSEFTIVEGAGEALLELKAAGYLLIVATNQPEVARGIQTRSRIDSMHRHLRNALPLDDIYICFHDDEHRCACRKPLPGLLTEAATKWDISLKESIMIGDRSKDVLAGKCAGCRTVLIRHEYNRDCRSQADVCADNLVEAAKGILGVGTSLVTSGQAL